MKVIFSGLESSGKSLKLASTAVDLVYRNSKWNKITKKSRPIVSNMRFAEHFENWASEMGVELRYWKDLEELINLQEADIICDEVGNYFDSRMWADLSLDVRRWLTQGGKCGIELYGSAQDFGQVDKSFRRLVNELYYIKKFVGSPRPSPTKPPVKKIWGVSWIFALDPRTYDENDDKFQKLSVFDWRFFFIRKEFCEIFDTTQKIVRSKPPLKRHEEWYCELQDVEGHSCDYHRIVHI